MLIQNMERKEGTNPSAHNKIHMYTYCCWRNKMKNSLDNNNQNAKSIELSLGVIRMISPSILDNNNANAVGSSQYLLMKERYLSI